MIVRLKILIDHDLPTFGSDMRSARIAIQPRKSVMQMCREVGISTPYWYRLEDGSDNTPIAFDLALKIEAVLETDLGIAVPKSVSSMGAYPIDRAA